MIKWNCTPEKCPVCASEEVESLILIHECDHVQIHGMTCLNCHKEFIGICYPHVVKE